MDGDVVEHAAYSRRRGAGRRAVYGRLKAAVNGPLSVAQRANKQRRGTYWRKYVCDRQVMA